MELELERVLLDEENRRLATGVRRRLDALVAPLGESIRLVWRGGGAPDAQSVLDNHLKLTAQRFIDLRETPEATKQRYYEEFCRHFNLTPAPDTFPLQTSPATTSCAPPASSLTPGFRLSRFDQRRASERCYNVTKSFFIPVRIKP